MKKSEFIREDALLTVEHDRLKLTKLNKAVSIGIEQAERGKFSKRSVQDIIKEKETWTLTLGKKTEKRKMRFLFSANLIIITLIGWMLCACQNSDSSLSHSSIKAITGAEQFKTIIQSSDNGLIMIDFYADWCGPCRKLEPLLEKLALENGAKVTVYRIDIDKHKKIATQYGVRSIPFVAFFKQQKVVHQMTGLYPKNEYLKIINQFS